MPSSEAATSPAAESAAASPAAALPGTGKTVCVTGANGFVGSHVVKQLLERGYTVRGTVRDAQNEKYGWLRTLDAGTPGKLELWSADLMEVGSYDKAVEGCEYVCHVAAAVQFHAKDPKREIVDPALEGTRNVFNAILKGKAARRVAVTSSVAAIRDNFQPNGRTYTEEDWHHELTLKDPYSMGKTLAEKLAWKLYEQQKQEKEQSGWGFELVVLNPALVLGEVLHRSQAHTSLGILINVFNAPLAPDLYFSVVHVRDVALAHVRALEKEEARGRFILAEEGIHSLLDIAGVVKKGYPQSRVPTLPMPTLLLYTLSYFSTSMPYEIVRRRAGSIYYFSNRRARGELGLDFIAPERAILDAAHSLVQCGLWTPSPTSAASGVGSASPGIEEPTHATIKQEEEPL